MKLTAAYVAMSDPDLNRHFSRRWTAPHDLGDCAVLPDPKTLEDVSLELLIDFRRGRAEFLMPAPAPKIDFSGINRAALGVLPSLLSRWLPDGRYDGHEYVCPQSAPR